MKFVHRYLDPSESLPELLFGLIMAFTITAGARLLELCGRLGDEVDQAAW